MTSCATTWGKGTKGKVGPTYFFCFTSMFHIQKENELSEALLPLPKIVILACVFSSILRGQPETTDVSELHAIVDSRDTAASREEKRLSNDHDVRDTIRTHVWQSKTLKYKVLLKMVTSFSGWMNLYGSAHVPRSKRKLFYELESSAVKDTVPGAGDRLADCGCGTVAHLAASYRQFLRPGVPRPFGWYSVFLKECCGVTEEDAHQIALFAHLFTRLQI